MKLQKRLLKPNSSEEHSSEVTFSYSFQAHVFDEAFEEVLGISRESLIALLII